MTTYSIKEFKAKASAILREIEDGEEVIITRRGRPCGKLTSVSASEDGKASLETLKGALTYLPDDGRTWDTDNRLLLVADAGNDLGYPSNTQRDDGAIVTVYYSDMHIARRSPRPEIIGIHGAAVIYRPADLP